jgi:hypothetical protein
LTKRQLLILFQVLHVLLHRALKPEASLDTRYVGELLGLIHFEVGDLQAALERENVGENHA